MSYFRRGKSIGKRASNGRFAKITGKDFGIGGVCPECQHLLIMHYYGDPREPFLDPFKWKYRCFTCEPRTDEELALEKEIEASRPKEKTLADVITATLFWIVLGVVALMALAAVSLEKPHE